MRAHPEIIDCGFRAKPIEQLDGDLHEDATLLCSYCGSLNIKDTLAAFHIPGTRYSGSDWKYGWPHKFYLDIPCSPYYCCLGQDTKILTGGSEFYYGDVQSEYRKFYSIHLLDATLEQMDEWNRVVAPLLGIEFHLLNDDLQWKAIPGWQQYGVIK